ncbi:hypothetical protein ACT43E_20850 (plasmid) [Acinetobacter baumannii]
MSATKALTSRLEGAKQDLLQSFMGFHDGNVLGPFSFSRRKTASQEAASAILQGMPDRLH